MSSSSSNPPRPLRIWPPIFLIALAFLFQSLPALIKDSPDWLWMVAVFGPLLCCLLVIIWWFAGSRASGKEKLLGFVGIILGAVIAITGLHPTMKGPGMLTLTIPLGIGGFAVAAILCARSLGSRRIKTIIAVTVLSFAFSLLLRNEGMWGNGQQAFRWRWTPTAEEQMLAAKQEASSAPAVAAPINSGKPEWPGFRGPNRDSRQSGIDISTDWTTSPPKEIWRIPVGPGWSSFAVQGNRLYTQEQRGPDEFVVSYAADTGQEIWTRLAGGRFDDPMGGPGPRATPELANGKLYGLTANGTLLCLDPADGSLVWKSDMAKMAGRKPPMWGYASSPLVFDNRVIVHAGGAGDKGTLAFAADTGDLQWSAPAGDHSYSSPHRSTFFGEEYIVMADNHGVRLLDPVTGTVRYFHDSNYRGYRTLQPQSLGDNSLLLQASGGPGTFRLQLSKEGDKIVGKETWNTTWLKSDFNDCVIYDGHLYGFNGSILVCLDIETGERRWRGGRYGKGQVLLLEDNGLLLVISERGQAVLVRATPKGHQELATIQVFEGKAWSHPVVVEDRLYVRNAEKAVCYQLGL